jgi:hypothetical protein
MRLLRISSDSNLALVEYDDRSTPPYAILSHTWGAKEEEVSYKDLLECDGRTKIGYKKLSFCAKQALKDGLCYFWVDTCCIDKSSSAELAEAINSMFRWYQQSAQCYVYLSDVTTEICPITSDSLCSSCEAAFRESKWFKRGWTLQELLAPCSVRFFSKEEKELGNRLSLEAQIHETTHIPVAALQGLPMDEFVIKERMLWIRGRRTTRKEDMAYSLLGVLGVSMPPVYGEGIEAAFRRLLREVKDRVEYADMSHDDLGIYRIITSIQRDANDSCSASAETIAKPILESPCESGDVASILPSAHTSTSRNRSADLTVCSNPDCSELLNRSASSATSSSSNSATYTRQMRHKLPTDAFYRVRDKITPLQIDAVSSASCNAETRPLIRDLAISDYQRAKSMCRSGCICKCHAPLRFGVIPANRFIGSLSVVSTAAPRKQSPCTENSCSQQWRHVTKVTCRSPYWLLAQIVCLTVSMQPHIGINMSLRAFRVIPDDADVMRFAKAGDLEGVRSMIRRGLASPLDVNASWGVPVLSVSTYQPPAHTQTLGREANTNCAVRCPGKSHTTL